MARSMPSSGNSKSFPGGTDTTRAVTAAGLQAKITSLAGLGPASEASSGIVELATQLEVTTGTDDLRAVTPLKLQQHLTAVLPPSASETVAGLVELATSTETTTGTDTTRAVTPAGLAAKVPSGTPLSVVRYTATGTAQEASPLSVDAASNVLLGTTAGTSATLVLALGSGTAPTTSPADAVQLWVADLDGVAGTTALHVRSEDGVLTRLGTGLLARKAIVNLTTATIAAPLALTADDSGRVYIGNNASAMAQINLPSAIAGLTCTFTVRVAQGLRIRAFAGDTIRSAAVGATAAAGYYESTTIYSTLTLTAINTADWYVTALTGTWVLGV